MPVTIAERDELANYLEPIPKSAIRRVEYPRPIRKTLYTLCVNDYAPRIRELTFPLMKAYAAKIGADFHVITERKRPEWPVTIEKFAVAELARERGDEWAIFFDADTLISPEMFDVCEQLPRDTVCHNGSDFAGVRWSYDNYFRRDGRNLGSCTWCVIASDWTVEDLWRLPEDSPEETFERIHITVGEHNSGQCSRQHLIDDYTLSRNIARFGLKATTIVDICAKIGYKTPDGRGNNPFLWHLYTITEEEKLSRMLAVLSTPQGFAIPHPQNPEMKQGGHPPVGVGWGLMDPAAANHLRKAWGVR